MNRFTKPILQTYQKWKISNQGVWFVDIPKTSSTSIRKELGNKYGAVFTKSKRKISIPPHRTAEEVKAFLGAKKWERLFTFSIVRNPWDRALSYFLWSKSNGYKKKYDFRGYIFELNNQFETGEAKFSRHAYLGCSGFLYSKEGELLVDFVAKFENRAEDLEIIRGKINERQHFSSRQFSKEEFGATKSNAATQYAFGEYYDEELIEIVGRVYQKDIELFGYEVPVI